LLYEEQKLVMSLIRGELDKKIDSKHLNWGNVLNLCEKHKLLSILYNHIGKFSHVPNYVFHYLSNEYKIQAHRSSNQKREFLDVLKHFYKNGIKTILLKGVFLASKCYGDAHERPYLDMDILIKKDDAAKAFEILKDLGYIQGKYNRKTKEIEEFDDNRLLGYESELQHYGEFAKTNKSEFLECFFIDVHHRLNTIFDDFAYDIDALFERSVMDSIEETKFYRLSNEDFVLHLASHLYWHTLSIRDIISGRDIRLLQYYDILLFMMKYPIQWDVLINRVNEYNLKNAFYYTFYHCQQIFSNIVPDEIYQLWNIDELNEVSRAIYDRWFTRDTLIPVGRWNDDFLERIFNDNRKNEALVSFYNDYINKVLFSGGYFKVIDINSDSRF
jgi:hypothetical protein